MNHTKIVSIIPLMLGALILSGCLDHKNQLSTQKSVSTSIAQPHSPAKAFSSSESQAAEQQLNESQLNVSQFAESQPIDSKPTVTVWVHGTRLITRFAPQELFFSPAGMKAVKEIPEHYHMYKIAKELTSLDPKRFQMDNFYLFGWTGRLSFNARKKAAEDLYNALITLTTEYKDQYGITPTFRIITHSHGGNVALNLAAVKNETTPIIVSELILLACPVQEQTKNFTADSLFNRVYSFFSRGEFLQVIDPQGLYKGNDHHPLFSKRIFPENPKLSQAEIKIYGRSILHAEFIFGHFVYKLPAILDALDKEHAAQNNINGKKIANKNDYVIVDLAKKHKRKSNKRVLII